MAKQLRIVINIGVGDGEIEIGQVDTEYLDDENDDDERTSTVSTGQPSAGAIEKLIRRVAPPKLVPFELRYVERVVKELDLDPQLPDSPKRKFEYVNVYPPSRYGARRASAFGPKSGRVEIYCSPNHADEFEHAEVVLYNRVPTWVRVYLTSDEAVNDAVALTAIGLRER